MSDNIFLVAIIISLSVHLVFLGHLAATRKDAPVLKKTPETSYMIEKIEEKKQADTRELMQKVEAIAPKDSLIKAGVPQPMPMDQESFFKDKAEVADNFQMYERKPEKLKGLKVTREVAVPMLKSEKINTPAYVTYYQIVRDRIRDRAYTNYTKLSVGEVFLTFIIRAEGSLGELQILTDKTTANDFLKEIGIKSVKESAPFPPFPADLNYPELTFNVSISFQYREE